MAAIITLAVAEHTPERRRNLLCDETVRLDLVLLCFSGRISQAGSVGDGLRIKSEGTRHLQNLA